MSYDAQEASADDGRPFFLYLFDDGVTQTRLTSDPVAIEADPEALGGDPPSWTPSPVLHGKIEQTGNVERSELTLVFGLSDTFARTFLDPALRITTVTVWRGHHSDLAGEFEVAWKGRVVGCRVSGERIEMSVESIFTSLRRSGCSRRQQRPCAHVHYHTGCNLDRGDFEVAATVSAVDGKVLTVAEAAAEDDGEYRAGILEWNGLLGLIVRHEGDQLTLLFSMPGLAEAVAVDPVAVTIAPGCNLSLARCHFFENTLNYGGFPWMSSKNPFNSSVV